MKVVITGGGNSLDTSHVLGKWFLEIFKDAVQLSRSTGYDFYTNYDSIVSEARKADLFINCSCVDDYQIKLLEDVYGHVPYMLVVGSISGDFHLALDNTYSKVKHQLKKRCKMIPLEKKDNSTNLLHLTITEVENEEIKKDGVTKDQLKELIEFWIKNPIMANVDLKFFISDDFLSEEKIAKVNKVLEFYAKN